MPLIEFTNRRKFVYWDTVKAIHAIEERDIMPLLREGKARLVSTSKGSNNPEFGKGIEATPSYMTKGEYVFLHCGGDMETKFEEVEWGTCQDPVDVYINKWTQTGDLIQHQELAAFGQGSDTMVTSTNTFIKEYGVVAIGDAPYLLTPPKEPLAKPDEPWNPDP